LLLSVFTLTEPLAAGTTAELKKRTLVAHEKSEKMRIIAKIPGRIFFFRLFNLVAFIGLLFNVLKNLSGKREMIFQIQR
jgi:hypothetical protein